MAAMSQSAEPTHLIVAANLAARNTDSDHASPSDNSRLFDGVEVPG